MVHMSMTMSGIHRIRSRINQQASYLTWLHKNPSVCFTSTLRFKFQIFHQKIFKKRKLKRKFLKKKTFSSKKSVNFKSCLHFIWVLIPQYSPQPLTSQNVIQINYRFRYPLSMTLFAYMLIHHILNQLEGWTSLRGLTNKKSTRHSSWVIDLWQQWRPNVIQKDFDKE